MGTRLANAQKCVRTTDIEEVGDSSHLTMLEMLGHWSLGDYYKKEALEWIWEWLTGVNYLGLDQNKLYVTVYEGDKTIPPDEESIEIWRGVFKRSNIDFTEGKRWVKLGRNDNWWEIAGANNSPAGPDSEIFYYLGKDDNPDFCWGLIFSFLKICLRISAQFGSGRFSASEINFQELNWIYLWAIVISCHCLLEVMTRKRFQNSYV
jgi:hypothetical protein